MFGGIKKKSRDHAAFVRGVLSAEKDFLKRIGVLLSGSVLAQSLPILAAPLLSRLFTPEEIGIWGLYAASVSVCAILMTLHYEMAILIPKAERDASALVWLCLFLASVCAVLLWAIGWLFGEPLLAKLGLSSLGRLWVWIPVGGFLVAMFQTLGTWHVRKLRFKGLAASRVSQSATTAVMQLAGGGLKAGKLGLIGGQLIGQSCGVATLTGILWKNDRDLFKRIGLKKIKQNAYRFRRFPGFSLLAGVANVVANNIPLFLMGVYFSPTIVGFFALTQRVLTAPLALVGTAVLDAFKERAATDYREKGSCRSIYKKTSLGLFLCALPPFLALFFAGPSLFAFVFGESWREAGIYAQILAPLLLVRFVASPLSYILFIVQKQNMDMIWQLSLLTVAAVSMAFGGYRGDPHLAVTFLSAGFTVMYLIYMGISYHFAKDHTRKEKAP